ncbi:hypothetical protein DH2020_012217 [Rehmannia glutinosa]|uniref:Lipoyl-binding domain-containing protein n=1 Tax=Rehmannia glutinosa TaxID=99300 RepID=A0ABR0WYP5_REHGL
MAASGFGTSGLKVTNLDLGSVGPKLRTLHGLRTRKIVRFDGLVLSHRSKKAVYYCQRSNSEANSVATTNLEENTEETVSSDALSTLSPNSFEVEALLKVLCDTTSVAEIELKLHVTRNLAEQSALPQEPPVLAPVTAHAVVETPGSNSSASPPSLALTKQGPSSGGVQTLLDKAADEGLMILQSPRVGYFRRSRTIKGKRAPPSCKEKDIVKEGRVLCYIEQLGGEIPVESDVSGEVVKILREDGDPVGYGDALIAVLPSFPGI